MTIRAADVQDRSAVADVIRAAFASDGEKVATLWADVVGRGVSRAELVAVDDDGLTGHVGLSHAWLDTRERLVDILILSPLSVHPDRQGAGVGTALVGAALTRADELGSPALVLEGSPDFYGGRGFVRAAGHGVHPPSQRTPEPAFQVALLTTWQPWMTGRVVYRDVWWEHDAAGLRDPELAQIEQALGLT